MPAGVVVAEGVVEITADADGVPRGVVNAIDGSQGSVDAAGRRTGSTLLAGIGGVISAGIVAVLAAGAFAAGVAIGEGVKFGIASVDVASSAQQSTGAAETIFGDFFGFVEDRAATAAGNVGLSNGAYLELANILGSQLKNGGVAFDEIAGKTDNLIQKGADMSAMFGGTAAEAVGAISAALRGERDTIERYGVSLTQAGIDAEAAALGFSKVNGQWSIQASQAATLSLINKQTSDSMGQFAEESDTLAGAQQRLGAMVTNAQQQLGEHLLPALTDLANFAMSDLLPILTDLIDQVGPQLGDALIASAPALKDLAIAFADMLPSLIQMAVDVLPALVDLFVLIVPLIVDWTANTASLWDILSAFVSFLSGDTTFAEFSADVADAGGSVFAFANVIATAVGTAIGQFIRFSTEVGTNVNNFMGIVGSIPGRVASALAGAASWLVNIGRDVIGGLVRGIEGALGWLRETLTNVTNLIPSWKGPPEKDRRLLTENGGLIMQGFMDGIRGEVPALRDMLGGIGASLPDSITVNATGVGRAAAASSGVGGVTLRIDHVSLDASRIETLNDLIDMFLALPQVARTGRERMATT